MKKPENKQFKVVWEASVLRADVEQLVPDGLTTEQEERMVHDLVYLQTLEKMQAGNPDSITWTDEHGARIRQLIGHHTESAMAGETAPVEYDTTISWEEEAQRRVEENK